MAIAWTHVWDSATTSPPDWYWLVTGGVLALLLVGTIQMLKAAKRLRSGWDIRDRKERGPVLMVMTAGLCSLMLISHFLGYSSATMVYGTMAGLFAAITLITILLRFKISIHVSSISALLVSLALTQVPWAIVVLPAVLLVAHARVKGGYHTVREVVAGALLPILLLPPLWRFFWCLTLSCGV